jgi:hypothetical protein
MEKIKGFFTSIFGGAGAIVMLGLAFAIPIGDLYWLWMAIQLGSYWMFVLGMLPFTAIFVGPIGIYCLLFGVPSWIFDKFG